MTESEAIVYAGIIKGIIAVLVLLWAYGRFKRYRVRREQKRIQADAERFWRSQTPAEDPYLAKQQKPWSRCMEPGKDGDE